MIDILSDHETSSRSRERNVGEPALLCQVQRVPRVEARKLALLQTPLVVERFRFRGDGHEALVEASDEDHVPLAALEAVDRRNENLRVLL